MYNNIITLLALMICLVTGVHTEMIYVCMYVCLGLEG